MDITVVDADVDSAVYFTKEIDYLSVSKRKRSIPLSPRDSTNVLRDSFSRDSVILSSSTEQDSDYEYLTSAISRLQASDDRSLTRLSASNNFACTSLVINKVAVGIEKALKANCTSRHVINSLTQYMTERDLSTITACIVTAFKECELSTSTYVSLNPVYSDGKLTVTTWYFSNSNEDVALLNNSVNRNLDIVSNSGVLTVDDIYVERYTSNWVTADGDPLTRMRVFSEGRMMIGKSKSQFVIWL